MDNRNDKIMKNRIVIFIANFITNFLNVGYVSFIAKNLVGQTLLVDLGLCIMNFTILKKIIENKDDSKLWLFYSLGSMTGIFASMELIKYMNYGK